MKKRTRGGSREKDRVKASDAEEMSKKKEKARGGGREGNGRPPTAAAEIFYELNCAGGLYPRESMCEDQTPRREWFLPPSAPTSPPPPPPPSLS